MKHELLVVADHVVTAVLNGVFQGIILVLLVGLVLGWLTRTNAATRHAIWFLTLLLLVLLVPVHYRVDGSDTAALPPPEATGVSTLPVPNESTTSFSQAWQEPNIEASSKRSKSFKPVFFKIALPEIFPKPTGVIVLAVWMLLASVKLTLLVWRLREIRKLKLDSLPPPAGLQDLFLRIRKDLQITRPVALRLSLRRSPVVLGFLHPMILLPKQDPESAEITRVQHILRHELAHVARRDDWANLIQHSIRAVFFFHPAIWWVSRQLSLDREIACDDSVLHWGGRPRSYALLLAELAGRSEPNHPVFAPGVSNNKTQLQTRINMILNTRRNTSPHLARTRLGIFTMSAAVAGLIAVYAAPRLVLAQTAVPPVPAIAPQPFPSPKITPAPELAQPGVPAPAELADTEPPDADPVTPLPPKVPPGAKYKPVDPSDDTPAPPYVPPTPKALRPPKVRAFPKALAPAGMAMAAEPVKGPEAKPESSSLEERLARVEKMVRSLMRRQNLDEPRHGSHNSDGVTENEMMQNELRHVQEMAKRQAEMATEQAKRAVEQAKREVEMATEQAKRAVAQAKREAELHARGIEQDKHNAMGDEQGTGKEAPRYRREPLRDGSNREFDALQKEHDRLEKEMERLNRRMERLQQDKQRLEKDQNGLNSTQPGEPESGAPHQVVRF